MIKVGTVLENEKEEICNLNERLTGFRELLFVLDNNSLSEQRLDYLHENLVNDIRKTKAKYDKWWHIMSNKYGWKRSEKGRWTIDFDTNEVFLTE